MIDLKRVRSVALDIADCGQSYERQDELSDFIWHLLRRHYRIFLFTTEPDGDLSGEDFSHPDVVLLHEEMPPSQAVVREHPTLLEPETLWITDDSQLQLWIRQAGAPFMYLRVDTGEAGGGAGGEADVEADEEVREADGTVPPPGQRLTRLSELSAVLDPTGLLLGDLAHMTSELRRERPQGPLLVGVGGPPLSGFQQFALDLRGRLEDSGHDLVQLLDVSSLLRDSQSLLDSGQDAGEPWVSPRAAQWLSEAVLAPLRAGQAVYVERLPQGLPADFEAHFPFYVSDEAVLLVMGELLFTPVIADALHLAVLLEVAPDETTRRLYEIPAGEVFDQKFTAQYLSREGRIYEDYLRRHRVRERATVRVNATRAGAFVLDESGQGPLV